MNVHNRSLATTCGCGSVVWGCICVSVGGPRHGRQRATPATHQSLGGRSRRPARRRAGVPASCCLRALPTGPPGSADCSPSGPSPRSRRDGCCLGYLSLLFILRRTGSLASGRRRHWRLPESASQFWPAAALWLSPSPLHLQPSPPALRLPRCRSGDPVPGNSNRDRLCRGARGTRAQRPHRGGRAAHGGSPPRCRADAPARGGAQRYRDRRSGVSFRSKRTWPRRSTRCGPAATILRAICISSASVPPAPC